MTEHSGGENSDVDWNTDDELEINYFQLSQSSSPVHFMSETSTGADGATSSNSIRRGISDETVASFIDMGFSDDMIARAIEETGGANPELILETLVKYSTESEASSSKSEASSSKSKVIDYFIGMGFPEKLVIKAIQEYGDKNVDELTNVIVSYAVEDKLQETEDKDIINITDDDNHYSLSPDEENELNSSHEDSLLQALIEMDYSRQEAAIAIERCGENASVAEVVDFICAAQMARQFDEFFAVPNERELIIDNKKKRVCNEPPRKERKLNTAMTIDDNLIRLPNPMTGFGLPNGYGLMSHRPVPIPGIACGPPYFYYENVAKTTKGVWDKISSHLYDIMPEFVDSIYFCAAARKRGYIHNLPIHNRFQIQPPPPYTIQEVFPLTKKWWPTWDTRTKLNCLVTCTASAQLTNKIRESLEKHDGEPPLKVQKEVIKDCKKWNLVWIGKNKVAPLEPDEMEELLRFPKNHTRGVTRTDRYKSLGNSFQVDTVAYHLSVLKSLFPNGINVLSLFTGIGGAEVALDRLGIRMNVVVSVEISEVNRNILRSFWEQTNQTGVLREFRDVQELDHHTIERLMDEFGGFDLVIGGSPCNNLAGCNRVSRVGLEGEQSSLFFDYCRILDTVRGKAARMRRRGL